MSRPKLLDRSETVAVTDESPAPARRADGDIVTVKKSRAGDIAYVVFGSVRSVLLLTAAVLGVAWVTMTTTVIAVPLVDGRPVLTVRGTYAAGSVPIGTLITVTPGPVQRGPIGKADDVFLGPREASVVRTVSGPYDVIATLAGTGALAVNGELTDVVADVETRQLDGTYATVCVAGPCGNPGELVLVPMDHIVGTVRNQESGIPDPATPADSTDPAAEEQT